MLHDKHYIVFYSEIIFIFLLLIVSYLWFVTYALSPLPQTNFSLAINSNSVGFNLNKTGFNNQEFLLNQFEINQINVVQFNGCYEKGESVENAVLTVIGETIQLNNLTLIQTAEIEIIYQSQTIFIYFANTALTGRLFLQKGEVILENHKNSIDCPEGLNIDFQTLSTGTFNPIQLQMKPQKEWQFILGEEFGKSPSQLELNAQGKLPLHIRQFWTPSTRITDVFHAGMIKIWETGEIRKIKAFDKIKVDSISENFRFALLTKENQLYCLFEGTSSSIDIIPFSEQERLKQNLIPTYLHFWYKRHFPYFLTVALLWCMILIWCVKQLF